MRAPAGTTDPAAPPAHAKHLAQLLAQETPNTATAVKRKNQRTNWVFIDWSQNNPATTAVAPYSLRGRDHPTVSTPIIRDEVHACQRIELLTFTADDVLGRINTLSDPFSNLDHNHPTLPALPGGTTP
jgi:bifunctional non-homologous end joining protein LigD